jgi:hypothetical protein
MASQIILPALINCIFGTFKERVACLLTIGEGNHEELEMYVNVDDGNHGNNQINYLPW